MAAESLPADAALCLQTDALLISGFFLYSWVKTDLATSAGSAQAVSFQHSCQGGGCPAAPVASWLPSVRPGSERLWRPGLASINVHLKQRFCPRSSDPASPLALPARGSTGQVLSKVEGDPSPGCGRCQSGMRAG